jgi:hypothetical protein
MVTAVRQGQSLRGVAAQFGVGVATVALWVRRAAGQRLDRVEWGDQPSAPHKTRRTDAAVEERVLQARRALAEGDLGAVGAAVIRQELLGEGLGPVPSVRTINRILGRRGALDGKRRTRRPAPPRGWYLPDLASGKAELDCVDIVEGLVIKGGPQVEVLNSVSLHGGLVASWPVAMPVTTDVTLQALEEHWREVGLPRYAQFDNDPIFQGTHRWPDALGRVIRLCLSLAVVPVFVPPAEMGFQAMIESYNGWWQRRVWSRFTHPDLQGLQQRSARHVQALRKHRAARIEAAPRRRAFPARWAFQPRQRPTGRVVYLRRSNGQSQVTVLGQSWPLGETWPHRLVRAEVDLANDKVRFFRLRRREPNSQPQILEVDYRLPNRGLQE